MGVVLVWSSAMLLNRIGLGYGLGDVLLRHALKISVGGCCNPLRCDGDVME